MSAILLYQHLFQPMQSPSRLPIDSMSNPFTHSLNPSLPQHYSPYNYHNVAFNGSPVHRQPHQGSLGQDGPTQSINLNDNVSFARNFKARLYQADPNEEMNKHKQQDKYRQELKMQIEEDRRRRAIKKAKEQEDDLKLQRKFYDNMQIQAQQKVGKKEEPNFFMMRTAKGMKKHHHHHKDKHSPENNLNKSEVFEASRTYELAKGELLRRTFLEPQQIIKRGGYHNQSSLDRPHPETRQPNPEVQPERSEQKYVPPLIVTVNQQQNISNQMAEQQDRITKLLVFQQNMLKKLDYFKKEIYQTSQSLRLDEEYEKIKLKLRTKPIDMQKVHSLASNQGVDDFLENSDMYHLPVISKHHRKIYEGEREMKKKKISLPIRLHDQLAEKDRPLKEEQRTKEPEGRQRAGSNAVSNDKNFSQFESDPLKEDQFGKEPEPLL